VTSLTSYVSRFLQGEAQLEKAIGGPVLLVQPRVPSHVSEDDSEYQFKTESGVTTPTPGFDGEACVLEVRKQKDNAFQRGVTLGRTGNNDLVIDDGSVSRFHAWFQWDADARCWSVADAGSRNGTRVDREKLPPKRLTVLRGGERLRFGKVDATFLMPRAFLSVIRSRLMGEGRM
jgi:hypothetical protein